VSAPAEDVTDLLNRWANGDEGAGERVFPLVCRELCRIASRSMNRQASSHTLQTTALVHEAYIRLAGDSAGRRENRGHFFGVAAKAMRHFLVDHARAGAAAKRGGSAKPLSLEDAVLIQEERRMELIVLDDALTTLAGLHPRQSRIVELCFFGGLNVEETAEALKISPETVARDWRAAKAWLYSEMAGRNSAESGNDA
jgi:RNA polymerase sigma factor (TIGR02999 family)